jgi:LPXTG-motif cell wall-anchored protein
VKRLAVPNCAVALAASGVLVSSCFVVLSVLGVPQAFAAATPPYELVCSGSSAVYVFNDVVTYGTITPSDPKAGQKFDVTGYYTKLPVPSSLVSTAASIQSTFEGTARSAVEVSGATPSSFSQGSQTFSQPISKGSTSLTVNVPTKPATLGPFTASGGPITVTQSPTSSLTIVLSATDALDQTCKAYSNNSNTPDSGILANSPTGGTTSPVITTSSASTTTPSTTSSTTTTSTTTSTTVPSTSPTTTPSAAPTTPSSDSSLPYTGTGSRLWFLAVAGALLVAGAMLLLFVDRARRRWHRGLHSAGRRSP